MDQNEKVSNDKITKLENEIKVLKNEVQAVLLDLRESYLNMENPFSSAANPAATQQIVITERALARESRQEPQAKETPKPENTEPRKSMPEENRKPDPDIVETEDESPLEGVPINEFKIRPTRQEAEITPVLSSKPESRPVSQEPSIRKNSKLDLVTMAGLTGWVENSVKKLGRERTEAVLDISGAMGYVSSDLKPLLLKLISLSPQSSDATTIGTRDYVDSLIKLNSLLGNDNREEAALLLLSILSGDTNRG
jgi:hypothetical protein